MASFKTNIQSSLATMIVFIIVAFYPSVTLACQPTDTTCEFWLEVEHKLTMMNGEDAVYSKGGQLYMWNDTSASTPVDIDNVITMDGFDTHKLVIAVNSSTPGPPIEVWQGQTVIVHVTNQLHSEAITIHWHGLHQVGTPWMDGVSFITMCPIGPHQTFTYKFKAEPSGTFWYHGHLGSQLSGGLLGPLIVRTHNDTPENEHIMMLQEYNHDYSADEITARMDYGSFVNLRKQAATKSIEGTSFTLFEFQAGLINGRGSYLAPNTGVSIEGPLEKFKVIQGQEFKFRIIGSGSLYPFQVSIDSHQLTVVATDGFGTEPVKVDYLIINPGERYDVTIQATQPLGRYWIRAKTLEINVKYHSVKAILEYVGTTGISTTATSTERVCSQDNRCRVLNCPFQFFPSHYFSDCVHVGDLRSLDQHNVPGVADDDEDDVEEIFLNFAFPGTTWTPGSVNGRSFKFSSVSALTQPQELSDDCDTDKCGKDKICMCHHTLSLKANGTYQFVLSNMGSGRGWAHPIHMHGHSFHVVKLGFPTYSADTAQVGADSEDISCNGKRTNFCNAPSWTNTTWKGNTVPGLELQRPIRKDTIMVPSGGYVVVRIKADNPGAWFMHCHIEMHSGSGMAIVLNESFSNIPPPPVGFPTCGDFQYTSAKTGWPISPTNPRMFEKLYNYSNVAATETAESDASTTVSLEVHWVTVGILSGIIAMLLLIILCLVLKSGAALRRTSLQAENLQGNPKGNQQGNSKGNHQGNPKGNQQGNQQGSLQRRLQENIQVNLPNKHNPSQNGHPYTNGDFCLGEDNYQNNKAFV